MRFVLLTMVFAFSLFSAKWVVDEAPRKMSWIEAKDFCREKKGVLPSIEDLENVNNSSFKKYFKEDFYWSSSENHNNLYNAYYFNFHNGVKYDSPKKFALNVRCVYAK